MTATFSDQEILEYLLGALDPARTVQIERALASSDELARRLTACQTGLPSLPPDDIASRWRLPPAGHLPRDHVYSGDVRLVAALGPEALHARDQFEVVVGRVLDAERRRVVVLYRSAGSHWRVLHPETADDDAPLSAFPVSPDGTRTLVLTAQPEPGEQDWAVALPFLEPPPSWEQQPSRRWSGLRRAVAEGRAPVFRFQVDVVD